MSWSRCWARVRLRWRRYRAEQARIHDDCAHDGSGRLCLVCCVQLGLQ